MTATKSMPSMRRTLGCLLAVLLLWVLGSQPAQARRLALVIGNAQYSALQPQSDAAEGADLMSTELRAAGFEVTSERNLGMAAMLEALNGLYARARRGDDVLVFYSGRTAISKGAAYLLPVDAAADVAPRLEGEAVSTWLLLQRLADLRLNSTTLLVDGVVLAVNEARRPPPASPELARIPEYTGQLVVIANRADAGSFAAALAARLRERDQPFGELAWQAVKSLEPTSVARGGPLEAASFSDRSARPLYLYRSGAAIVVGNAPRRPASPAPEPRLASVPSAGLSNGFVPSAAVPPARIQPSRFVNLDAPTVTRPAQGVAVQIWLSDTSSTPGAVVTPAPGQHLGPGGQLVLDVPLGPASWDVEAVISAPGFDPAPGYGNVVRLALGAQGDSSRGLFLLVPRAGELGARRVQVSLWYAGRYLASVSRNISIETAPAESAGASPTSGAAMASARTQAQPAAGPPAGTAPAAAATFASAGPAARVPLPEDAGTVEASPSPDLYVYIRHDDANRLGRGHIVVTSPHLRGNTAHAEFELPPDTEVWLNHWMQQFNQASAARGAVPVNEGTSPAVARRQRVAQLRGFGKQLYERLAPPLLKRTLEELLSDPRFALASIQIRTNNTSIPWELMRPGRVGAQDLDFLGLQFRMARWPTDGTEMLRDRPVTRLSLQEVAVVAPSYSGPAALPAQGEELAFLSKLRGFRRVAASFEGLQALARQPPSGIVHYAGHGELRGPSPAQRQYSLHLDDGPLDVTTWRGLGGSERSDRSLYFFNACDLGVVEALGGAATGWAPAILDSGAGGYIGGLWALHDQAAQEFAMRFYAELSKPGAAPRTTFAAEALKQARRLFLETGDTTYLAYVFYGDVNLRLTLP